MEVIALGHWKSFAFMMMHNNTSVLLSGHRSATILCFSYIGILCNTTAEGTLTGLFFCFRVFKESRSCSPEVLLPAHQDSVIYSLHRGMHLCQWQRHWPGLFWLLHWKGISHVHTNTLSTSIWCCLWQQTEIFTFILNLHTAPSFHFLCSYVIQSHSNINIPLSSMICKAPSFVLLSWVAAFPLIEFVSFLLLS